MHKSDIYMPLQTWKQRKRLSSNYEALSNRVDDVFDAGENHPQQERGPHVTLRVTRFTYRKATASAASGLRRTAGD